MIVVGFVEPIATRHIQEHSLGEATRIGRRSRIREFVLGAQDGLLVPGCARALR